MTCRVFLPLLLLAAAAALPGCRHAARPPMPASPAVRQGSVAVEVVPDPNAPLARLEESQEYRAPQAVADNPMPIYPPDLVNLGLPRMVVGVRIVIGAEGRVVQVAPSPVQPSTGGHHAAAFESSVRRAVSAWRFSAPVIRSWRPGQDVDRDGKPDYAILDEETPVQVQLDLRFVFDLVDGRGRVGLEPLSKTR